MVGARRGRVVRGPRGACTGLGNLVAVLVYGVCVTSMLAVSVVYHSGRLSPRSEFLTSSASPLDDPPGDRRLLHGRDHTRAHGDDTDRGLGRDLGRRGDRDLDPPVLASRALSGSRSRLRGRRLVGSRRPSRLPRRVDLRRGAVLVPRSEGCSTPWALSCNVSAQAQPRGPLATCSRLPTQALVIALVRGRRVRPVPRVVFPRPSRGATWCRTTWARSRRSTPATSCGGSTGLPPVALDLHLGSGLPRHPRRAGGAPRAGLLLDRRRARRRGRGHADLRARRHARSPSASSTTPRRSEVASSRRRTPAHPGASTALHLPQPARLRRRRGLRAAPRRARRRRVARRLEAVGVLAAADQGRLGAAADGTEVATVRRWTRADWGDEGETMAWCCTEGERPRR